MAKIFSHFSANGIKIEDFPFKVESSMEGYIWDNPDVLKISDDDEVQIHALEEPWKRKGNEGRIDIFASYNNDTLAIVELKKDELRKEHFEQLNEYFADNEYINKGKELVPQLENPGWIGVLVGSAIEASLKDQIENNKLLIQNKIPIAAIILKRYRGENQTFIISEIFASKTGRDYTKYEFLGETYTKGRLVLALVKKLIEDGKDFATINKLVEGIPFLKTKPFLEEYEKALNYTNTPNSKGNYYCYYFVKPSEAVFIENVKYAVMNWWTIKDMPFITKNAKKLGYEIEKV